MFMDLTRVDPLDFYSYCHKQVFMTANILGSDAVLVIKAYFSVILCFLVEDGRRGDHWRDIGMTQKTMPVV